MRPRLVLVRAWPLLAALLLSGAVCAQEPDLLTGETLVRSLRAEGGYNLYFRHAETDWSQDDFVTAAGDWTSCDPTRVRQLSEAGRETARAVGDAIRRLGIPVGRVLASPYCRTVETAELMGLGPVETTTDVMNLRVAHYFGGREAITETARALLATPPAPGTNTVIVAHGNVVLSAAGIHPEEGEGLVFRPDGERGFRLAGRLDRAQWRALAQAFTR